MRCWLLGTFLQLASGLAAQQYPFIRVAGSPGNVERVLEDRQGRLWIASHFDLLCFDGSHFYSLREFGFPAKFSYGLIEDAEGGILSGTPEGIYRFYQGRLEHPVAGLFVYEMVGVAPGVFLATVFRGPQTRAIAPYRIRAANGAWQAEELTGWKTGINLTRDRSGTVLAACPGGWCEITAKMIVNWSPSHPGAPILHRSGLDIGRVLRDRFGCLWFRSAEAGAYQCPGDPEPIPLPAAVAGRNVWAAATENEDGSMTFANGGSLAVGRPGAFQVVTPADGLPAEAIASAVRTHDGSIWLATIGGLYRFPYPFHLTYWKSRHGLVWSLTKSGGRILAGTGSGVARLDENGEWTLMQGSREFGSVSSLVSEPDGSIYAAVSRQAVIQLLPRGTLAARTPPGQGGQAEALARASDGSIWLAGAGFYRVLKNGPNLSLVPENPHEGAPDSSYLASDPAGVIWGCFAGSLIRREGEKWRTVVDNRLPQLPCRALALLANGDVWIGYDGGRADGGQVDGGQADFVFAQVHPGTPGTGAVVHQFHARDATFSFGSDTRGWLWRGSTDGMYVADTFQASAGVWLHLDGSDGLTGLDVNHDSFFSDPDGSVWWAADASIIHFSPPPDLVHPGYSPPIFLSAFSLNGGPPKLAETFREVPHGQRVTAHIGSLQFQGRNALGIRYRLLPESKNWRETTSSDVDLGAPRWGTHTLEIQSRFSMGPWSTIRSWPLVVLRPWWFSWPAILGFAGIGAGGTAGAIRWRRKLRLRARTTLPDLAQWRLAALVPESKLIGTTLDGRFEVLSLVAQGGFATIFKGADRHHSGRWCAIKVFRQGVVDEQWLTHRFQQEVSALEQIRHPSVVSIYGHGISPAGSPYLVMEFIEGDTLRDLLTGGALPCGRTASLMRQAASALEQIHARGIYHRDLKPENLMLRAGAIPGRELVLIDFSIAIVKEPDQTIHGLSRAAGTIYYMAPEQAVGFATPASDIYGLTKVVLEMMTGQRLSALLPDASMDLPERAREFLRRLPIRLSAESVEMLGSALEFDPARRPQAALPFAQPIVRDLEAASSGLSASPCLYSTDGGPAAG
jgi:tRNA A-37 threonylcarbamoyl transferase component Bud32